MVSENEALRLRRLVFYTADIDRINAALLTFVRKSGATSALLIDQEGHLVARQGFSEAKSKDGSAMAALVAGSFASTREVAKLLGESEFRTLFHQGPHQSISVILIGERTLQVAVFPSAVKPGMVQVLGKELANQLEVILAEAAKRPPDATQPQLGSGFSDAMKDQLDNLFGNL